MQKFSPRKFLAYGTCISTGIAISLDFSDLTGAVQYRNVPHKTYTTLYLTSLLLISYNNLSFVIALIISVLFEVLHQPRSVQPLNQVQGLS